MSNSNNNSIFFDRLRTLKRHTSEGDVVSRGATDGTNTISIREGRSGSGFVVSYCLHQQLLLANVKWWPSSVSTDGQTITLWLMDHSAGRNGYRRKFELEFFDATATRKFFDTYVSKVPMGTGGEKRNFDQMIDVAMEMEVGGGDVNVENEEGGDVDAENEEGEEENVGGEEGGGGQHDVAAVEEEGKEEEDVGGEEGGRGQAQRMKDIIELDEEMWGESQNLFHPTQPHME